MADLLEIARAAYRRRDVAGAYDAFTAARQHGDLSTEDLAAWADSAWWLGRVGEAMAGFEEVHRAYVAEGRVPEAARLALEIGFLWLLRGEEAIGTGWLSRAARLLRDQPECAVHGHLRYLDVEQALAGGDFDGAIAAARAVHAIGERHHDPSVTAMGLLGEGLALIRLGRLGEGRAVLDEAMLPVLAGEVEPGTAGYIYCQLMSICDELADVRRAREWTDATDRWCRQFTAAAMFGGICRVHRAQLQVLGGDWRIAEREAARARDDLAEMNPQAAAEATYQIGEVRRFRGELTGAEQSYLTAHRLGRDPQPGLALLRLAQGRSDAARSAVRAALAAESGDRLRRSRLLVAAVEIELAAGDIAAATAASDELAAIAATYASSGLVAAARQAAGAVLLAGGRPQEALPLLRDAGRRWREIDAPYLAARVGVLLARAYRELGDADAAAREADAAGAVFTELGAALDAADVAALRGRPQLPGGLTEREAEVLSRIATGRSNREVAAALGISEKTVARHLANIYAKLDLPSRTAAVAFAHDNGLVAGTRG